MQSVLIYEFVTAGGCWSLGNDPPNGSLFAEGRAMRDALAADFAALSDVEQVWLLHDSRLPLPTLPGSWHDKLRCFEIDGANAERALLEQLAATAAATLLIAPEFSQLLLNRVQWAEAAGARLISPGSELVALASDKQRTAEHLAAHGVAAPRGVSFERLPPSESPSYPAVIKPADGAGSSQVQLLQCPQVLNTVDLSLASRWRLEQFHPGRAVSVAVLCGPNGNLPLAPCLQRLSNDGRFTYVGGSTPISAALSRRARQLALRAAATLSAPSGYIGFDLVLGDASDGSEDVVIEVNPRLTTSYVGLRRACHQNLAQAMWKTHAGLPLPVSFASRTIEFAADGTVFCPSVDSSSDRSAPLLPTP